MTCQCQKSGYCHHLGRHMPEGRWKECHKPAYYAVFKRESDAGKYTSAAYQRPYDASRDSTDDLSRIREQNTPQQPTEAPVETQGVGRELKRLLSLIGITVTPGCRCNKHAAKMNRLGPQWCRDNQKEIIGWMKEESRRRKRPFSKTAAKAILKLAIRRHEKKQATEQ